MTRKEAIARIKDHKVVHKMNEPRTIYISEALDMAIKALEQETVSREVYEHEYFLRKEFELKIYKLQRQFEEQALNQEPCEDCVSRQAVIDTIFAECSSVKLDIDFAKVLLLRRAIKTLPSIKSQEPKIAHWIVEVWNNREHYTCSACQRVVDYEPCYHYCPYCGAEMRESEE